jgi:hypothetical protein
VSIEMRRSIFSLFRRLEPFNCRSNDRCLRKAVVSTAAMQTAVGHDANLLTSPELS